MSKLPAKKKGGRPEEWDSTRTRRDLLIECSELGLSLDQTAAVAGINKSTINRYLNKHYGLSYAQFRKQNTGRTAKMLINRALNHCLFAEEKDIKPAVLIFLLKNYAGMMDRPLEQLSEENNHITLNYNLEKEPGEFRDVKSIQDSDKQD